MTTENDTGCTQGRDPSVAGGRVPLGRAKALLGVAITCDYLTANLAARCLELWPASLRLPGRLECRIEKLPVGPPDEVLILATIGNVGRGRSASALARYPREVLVESPGFLGAVVLRLAMDLEEKRLTLEALAADSQEA